MAGRAGSDNERGGVMPREMGDTINDLHKAHAWLDGLNVPRITAAGETLGLVARVLLVTDVQRRKHARSRYRAPVAWPQAPTVRFRIVEELWFRYRNGRHGATREELARALKVSENTIRPRVLDLIAGGWIGPAAAVTSGDAAFADRTRRTRSKHEAAVLVLTDASIEAMS